jgi:hypothetical protein
MEDRKGRSMKLSIVLGLGTDLEALVAHNHRPSGPLGHSAPVTQATFCPGLLVLG